MPDRLRYFGDCRHRQLALGARPRAVGAFDRRARKSATLDESDPRSKEVFTHQEMPCSRASSVIILTIYPPIAGSIKPRAAAAE